MTGQTINDITFLSFTGRKDSMGYIWKCKCYCGKIFESNATDIKRKHKTSCGCAKHKKRPNRIKNLVGQKFGRLTVIELLPDIRPVRYLCKCECGKYATVSGGNLQSGEVISCGCASHEKGPRQNLVGQKFGRLLVLECCKERKRQQIVWKCRCDCGKITYVDTAHLNNGKTKSCGCLQKEALQPFLYKEENLSGQKFGKLLVLDRTKRDKNNNIMRLCQCECGEKIWAYGSNLKRGFTKSCGKCIKSNGEESVKNILNQMNVHFEQEKAFDNCRNPKTNKKLRFDFYLPDYNTCIEYDGEQHFKESNMCSDSLSDRQYRDGIKNKFCKDNNIKLIRIPYTDFNKIDTDYILNRIGDKIEQ